jgi:hypothetical protein
MWTAVTVFAILGCILGGAMRAKEAASKGGKGAQEAKAQSAVSFACSGILAVILIANLAA